ncbi:MAG TPA: hypothetical protein VEL80_08575 [Burkholderiales bacterium]|nr:hypothetical protein [Burkholderiales bacterium]
MKAHTVLAGVALAAAASFAWAKLPPPLPADPAQAAQAKQKADEAAKKDAALLGKYQDKAAANYRKNKGVRGPAPKVGGK